MNQEHYQDPTAEEAISRIERKRQEKRRNRRYRIRRMLLKRGTGRDCDYLRIQSTYHVC